MFDFRATDPINTNFELLDVNDLNFLMNSGSFFIFMFLIVLQMIFKMVLHRILIRFHLFKRARNFSMWMKTGRPGILGSLNKLNIEMFIDMALAMMLTMYGLTKTSRGRNEFPLYFETLTDAFCSSLAIAYALMALVLPFFMFYKISRNMENKKLVNKEFRRRWGSFYTDVKLKKLKTALYHCFFISRRLITAYVLVFLNNFPYF